MVRSKTYQKIPVIVFECQLFTVLYWDAFSVSGHNLNGIKFEFSSVKRGSIQQDTHKPVISTDPSHGFPIHIPVPHRLYRTSSVGTSIAQRFLASPQIQ